MRSYNEVFPSDNLELKKDISYPGKYYRAGIIKLASEWEAIFPKSTDSLYINEWFINHTVILEKEKFKLTNQDLIYNEINYIFQQMNLNSISYKEAARKAIDSLIEKKILIYAKS